MRIYISGPLQGSTNLAAARRFYDHIAAIVESLGHEAYVPHHYTDPREAADLSAGTVFDKDLYAIESSDAVIAHIGLPSTGVGAEIALAIASHRSVLGVKRPNEPSSRFAEGLITKSGGQVAIFADDTELESAVRNWLPAAERAHELIEAPSLRHRHLAVPA